MRFHFTSACADAGYLEPERVVAVGREYPFGGCCLPVNAGYQSPYKKVLKGEHLFHSILLVFV